MARFCLTSPRSRHIPVCSLRTEAGDGEGGGWDLKMNVQPRAQQASPGAGKPPAARCLPAGGAVCRGQGVNRRPGSVPDCLAGKGGWRCPRRWQLGTPMGVWNLFRRPVPPGSRRDPWASRLGSGAHEDPDVPQGCRNPGAKAGGSLPSEMLLPPPESEREAESRTPRPRGTLRN